jgi:5'-3' exonuclease
MPLVIDANSLIKRCIMATALDDLKAGGQFTGGVYGALNTLRAFLESPEGRYSGPIVACFDAGIPKRRLELLPDYKCKREERKKLLTEEEKASAFTQIGLARKMMEKLGVLCISYTEREADDVVGAVASICLKHFGTPVVMSGDKDLWQMVEWGARVYDLNKKRWIDADNFAEITGVESSTYLLYKTLVGDPSDSIAGCSGCGDKRAKELILEATEHVKGFERMSTTAQLCVLRNRAAQRPKPRKFEKSLYENIDYLKRVVKAIDLRRSFGGTEGLTKQLVNWVPDVQKLGFLRLCKKLDLQSIIGAPDRYDQPFRRSAKKFSVTRKTS